MKPSTLYRIETYALLAVGLVKVGVIAGFCIWFATSVTL